MSELVVVQETEMADRKSKTVQFRASVPHEIDVLVRALVPLKNGREDWSIGDVATEALLNWLKLPENKELVEKYNLLNLLKEKGLPTNIYDDGYGK